jgi:hypothetical protein
VVSGQQEGHAQRRGGPLPDEGRRLLVDFIADHGPRLNWGRVH